MLPNEAKSLSWHREKTLSLCFNLLLDFSFCTYVLGEQLQIISRYNAIGTEI